MTLNKQARPAVGRPGRVRIKDKLMVALNQHQAKSKILQVFSLSSNYRFTYNRIVSQLTSMRLTCLRSAAYTFDISCPICPLLLSDPLVRQMTVHSTALSAAPPNPTIDPAVRQPILTSHANTACSPHTQAGLAALPQDQNIDRQGIVRRTRRSTNLELDRPVLALEVVMEGPMLESAT